MNVYQYKQPVGIIAYIYKHVKSFVFKNINVMERVPHHVL